MSCIKNRRQFWRVGYSFSGSSVLRFMEQLSARNRAGRKCGSHQPSSEWALCWRCCFCCRDYSIFSASVGFLHHFDVFWVVFLRPIVFGYYCVSVLLCGC